MNLKAGAQDALKEAEVYRLYEMHFETGAGGALPVFIGGAARHRDKPRHRQCGVGLDALGYLEAIHARQSQVQKNYFRPEAVRRFEGRWARERRVNVVAH